VWHNERVGSVFLGMASMEVPAAGNSAVVKSTLVLQKREKHFGITQKLAQAAGVQTHELGTLTVNMCRMPRAEDDDDAPGSKGVLHKMSGGRLGRKTSKTSKPGRKPSIMHGATPEPFTFVHVDIVRARRLLPMDRTMGKDASSWTSDPFVTAQLLPSGVGGETLQTSVKPTTLFPQWDEELLLKEVPNATTVKLCIYDYDKVGGNDMLGELTLPLPARPSEAGVVPQPLVQGWYPLSAPAAERESLVAALRAVGRNHDATALASERPGHGDGPTATAGVLGEVYVRLSWGHGGKAADVNTRPALRPRLATLRVRVHEARGLPAKFADRPVVVVRCETATGITPAALGTRDPVYPAELSDFNFVVTETTGDVVFTVLDRDPMLGDQIAGEVILPLHLLLAPTMDALPGALVGPRLARFLPAALRGGAPLPAAPAPPKVEAPSEAGTDADDDGADQGPDWTAGLTRKWAEILPPRLPGEAMQRVQPRPEKPLGALSFTVQLEMETDAFYAYMAPNVMPLTDVPDGVDLSQEFSLSAMNVSLGRMIDGIFQPMFAPWRTMLYLQSWQAPRMNGALIAALVFFTLFAWTTFRLLTPLWVMLWPVFHGYVSYLIHVDDYQATNSEDDAEEITARHADKDAQTHRNTLLWEAQKRALAAIREANDPAAAAAHAAAGVGALSTMTNSVASIFGLGSSENETAAAMSMYKKIKSKLEMAHVYGIYYGEILERWANVFTWRDKTLSAVMAVAFAVIGLVGSAALTAVCFAGSLVGLGFNHVFLLVGLTCFYPHPEGLRSFLETCDYYLSYIPISQTSHVAGTGLAITAPLERRVPLSEAALRERIEAEAAAYAEYKFKAEEAVKTAAGTVRPVTLNSSELLSMAWLYRLLWRAPNLTRDTHVNISRSVTAAKRPMRNWTDSKTVAPPPRTKSGTVSAATTPLAPSRSATPTGTPRPSADVHMEDTPPPRASVEDIGTPGSVGMLSPSEAGSPEN